MAHLFCCFLCSWILFLYLYFSNNYSVWLFISFSPKNSLLFIISFNFMLQILINIFWPMKIKTIIFGTSYQDLFLTVFSCHVMYAFQSESTLYNFLNVKELLAWSRREIWSLSDCNWTWNQNHLVRTRTLNSLAKWLSVRLRTKLFWFLVQLQSYSSISLLTLLNCCKLF